MAKKAKVKWYDTFNPFAHTEARKTAAKKSSAKKTVPVDHAAIIREKEKNKSARAAAKRGGYQGTPTDPSMDKKKVKVVKPKKK